jgi:tripartite-type tricarboxylate transporter receptor subunit TctC
MACDRFIDSSSPLLKWLVVAVTSGILGASVAQAEDYPNKPIKIVLPVGAGGSSDQVLRVVGRALNDRWGQPLVIEARPGATGMIGAEAVAKSPPDGYTGLFASTTFLQAPALFPNVPYDYLKDFAPVHMTVSVTTALVVGTESPIKSLKDYIAAGQDKEKPLTFGSVGVGSSPHIYGATFAKDSKTAMVHVTYRSEPAIVTDILGGHVVSCFLSIGTAAELVKAGKLRALAVTGPSRSQLMPDIPTFVELGYRRLDIAGWFGLLMPAGTPKPIVDKVAGGINEALHTPEVRKSILGMGLDPLDSTPESFSQFIRQSFVKWRDLINENGIAAQMKR